MKKQQVIHFAKGKGFTVALLLCVVGVVVATFAAVGGMFGPGQAQDDPTQNETLNQEEKQWDLEGLITDPVEKKQEEVPVQPSTQSPQLNGGSSDSLSGSSSKTQQDAVAPPAPAAPQYTRPAGSEIIQGFTGDELVFNETMQDWRTHNGVDYKAAYETDVLAACAGEVTKVEKDALWGTVVTVQSEDGLTMRYCGLAKKAAVKQGEQVAAGALLGKVGECPAEIAAEPHLHVEVSKDGQLIDPESLFS
ncbi:MAG: M23 family metallopeptidase [Oscillospiraceae bacterium]|nr:M23 family metallopeptidase [Oscillospiraceae bacterium]